MQKLKAAWRSPSNIALIKYWGKKGMQLPANPSFSMTLRNSFTETFVTCHHKGDRHGIPLEFLFDGNKEDIFEKKIAEYFLGITGHLPFIDTMAWQIQSSNTFPHSSGIASSASGISALALCLLTIENELTGKFTDQDEFFKRASFLSRLGSGSACRSVYGGFALWGKTALVNDATNEMAIPAMHLVHKNFQDVKNAILIVSSRKKPVSSRAGHGLMTNHPFASRRYLQAEKNLGSLLSGMKEGDWDVFVRIVETEALSLHAMMMTSEPSYILMEPNTLKIIDKIRKFRKESGIPACFTLDAGPNIHLLYPGSSYGEVREFITQELLVSCERNQWIDDGIGEGPVSL